MIGVEGHDDDLTYDYWIIQGRWTLPPASSSAIRRVEESFDQRVFEALGCRSAPRPRSRCRPLRQRSPPSRPRTEPPPESSRSLLQAVQAADLAVQGPPQPRRPPPARRTRSVRARSRTRRSTPRPLGLTPELMKRIPAHILRVTSRAYNPPPTRCRTCTRPSAGTIAYRYPSTSASHRQRVWLREGIEFGQFRQPMGRRREARAAQAPDRGRRLRALPGRGLPRPEAVSDPGPGHDRADDRRDHPGSPSDNGAKEVVIGMAAPRPAVGARAQPRPCWTTTIFAESEGATMLEAVTTIPQGGTGDGEVPPRRPGRWTTVPGEEGKTRDHAGVPTPSHLEFVSPLSRAPLAPRRPTARPAIRARTRTLSSPTATHGDAAFPAQGVAAEDASTSRRWTA